MKVCSDYGVLVFFFVYEIIWLFVAFGKTIRAYGCLVSVYESLVACA
jgi:hypothetical protein